MFHEIEIYLKEMSVQYWPSDGVKKYRLVSVTLQDETVLEDYVIRKFNLSNKTVLVQKYLLLRYM